MKLLAVTAVLFAGCIFKPVPTLEVRYTPIDIVWSDAGCIDNDAG